MAKQSSDSRKTSTKVGKNVEKSYLDRLKFLPEMGSSLVAKYIANIRFVILLIVSIALLGTVAYLNLPQRLNPEVKIPIVTIATVLPGASSHDVEKLVTIPIEDQVRNLKGLDVVNSSSQENVSVITIQFVSSVDRDKAKDDVQSAVDSAVLPQSAQRPNVRALDFEDQPIWTFALIGSGSYPDLMHSAKALEQELDDLSRIDRVQTSGFDQQEVSVAIDPAKVAQYGVSPLQLSDAIRKARSSYPAGRVVTGSNTFALSVDPEIETIADIRNLQLDVEGRLITLGEVAVVQERSVPNQPRTLFADHESKPQPAVVFYVYKTTTANIDDAGEQVKEGVNSFMSNHPELKITTLSNSSEMIAEQFTDLLGEFRSTMILVFVTLLLFLGLRQAMISSLTVPLTFLSAFFLMQFMGMSINFLTLFAFLLSLGLLVDDTIVVVSAMTTYYKTGKFTPLQTGVLVWKDTIVPIWSTTITTIWAFVPLLIASGIIGEFIKPIPIVVTLTMLSSTAIAVLITLPLMIVLLKPVFAPRIITFFKAALYLFALGVVVALLMNNPLFPLLLIIYILGSLMTVWLWPRLYTQFHGGSQKLFKENPLLRKVSTGFSRIQDHGVINLDGFADGYRRLMRRILTKKSSRRAVLIGVVIYAIFSFALLPLGFVKNEFFPSEESDEFFVRLELPAGARLDQTEPHAQPVLEKLIHLPEVEFATAEIGRSGGSSSINNALSDAQNNIFFSVRLKEKKEREKTSFEVVEIARETLKNYEGGKVTIVENSEGGPPAGADLQIKISGNDLNIVNGYADQIAEYLKTQPGLSNIEKSVTESTSKVRFVPDQAKLTQYGISIDSIGFALRLYASGFSLDQINFDDSTTDETNIIFRVKEGYSGLNGLGQIEVANTKGQTLPLSELGTFKLETNPTSIAREDFRRTISVTAAVAQGQSIPEANTKMEQFADSLNLPNGYAWQTGGVNEENQKSVQSILQAMVLSAILILITMVVQFQSFRKAIIVLIVIPLAVSSVFLFFALTGTPLSFPALIGVLSLFGIVVTNSMFIVDKINLNLREKMPFNEAIADAGASRMEPIVLTKLCTVLGLLPITLAEPLWRGLGGAIISGLLVASTIMLLFIPVLYYSWMGDEREKN